MMKRIGLILVSLAVGAFYAVTGALFLLLGGCVSTQTMRIKIAETQFKDSSACLSVMQTYAEDRSRLRKELAEKTYRLRQLNQLNADGSLRYAHSFPIPSPMPSPSPTPSASPQEK